MPRSADIAELRRALRSTAELREEFSEREIARDVAAGRIVRVRRGRYLDGALWADLWPESRHLAHVLAVAADARGTLPVFSHVSAAVLWGLPLYRLRLQRVHVLSGDADRCSGRDVFRHEGLLPDSDVVVRDGFARTSLDRTVADLASAVPAETGVAAADAALASIAGGPRDYRTAAADQWREGMRERLATAGARGIRLARRVAEFADGRAERPGESVSRLQLRRLGFRHLDLQVEVPVPHVRTGSTSGSTTSARSGSSTASASTAIPSSGTDCRSMKSC